MSALHVHSDDVLLVETHINLLCSQNHLW